MKDTLSHYLEQAAVSLLGNKAECLIDRATGKDMLFAPRSQQKEWQGIRQKRNDAIRERFASLIETRPEVAEQFAAIKHEPDPLKKTARQMEFLIGLYQLDPSIRNLLSTYGAKIDAFVGQQEER